MGSIPPVSTKTPPFVMKGGFAFNKPFSALSVTFSVFYAVEHRRIEVHSMTFKSIHSDTEMTQ